MSKHTRIMEALIKNSELTIFEIHQKTFLEPMDIFNILEGNKYGFQFESHKKEKGLVYSKKKEKEKED